jgi:hypothetical protein
VPFTPGEQATTLPTRATRAGIAIHTYQAAGEPTYGSFALDDQ